MTQRKNSRSSVISMEEENIDLLDFDADKDEDTADYIETDFAMIVHADGYVVHPESWRDEFLEYVKDGMTITIKADGVVEYADSKKIIIKNEKETF